MPSAAEEADDMDPGNLGTLTSAVPTSAVPTPDVILGAGLMILIITFVLINMVTQLNF